MPIWLSSGRLPVTSKTSLWGVLADRTYRHLFLAQVVALLGTGLATVALGLLAYDLAGGQAGLVLGAIFTIKMVAYVVVAPIAAAFIDRLPRRTVLVCLDIVRAVVAFMLPFVTQIWQIYVLIFVLQSASAAFTPAFQATIPDVLPDEERYTRALSLSRLAYDLENIVSPILAALLLMVVSSNVLFFGTLGGFAASAALVLSVVLPSPQPSAKRGIYERTTRGIRIYLKTPRLRGLLALNLAAAAAGAMVIVNTVVLIRANLGLGESEVAITLGLFGAGSMLAAFALPTLLDRFSDRSLMLLGAMLMTTTLIAFALGIRILELSWAGVLLAWLMTGIGYSAVLTPSGRLLRRSAHAQNRPALFAAQFALSHACWLVTYPLAGWVMTQAGLVPALLVLGGLSVVGIVVALFIWPKSDSDIVEHRHDSLPEDHPHVKDGRTHAHPFVIDDEHIRWSRHL
ncbi:hypothetical protein IMCC3135_16490 [Granulosicoccus antarcticus IMCC3135]|uniref:Major facilitator superfamily (MFS) profile domain-containing protein n=1 Tax=Granulosicoccus antarcticus IMCC3135 TaxID=1192854 RepID=A0A2Z2NWZ3_9GAMM|nr:hypothetical protein IMCC3135_16490 [Granulosicoccus antarcticus IMCC3135]